MQSDKKGARQLSANGDLTAAPMDSHVSFRTIRQHQMRSRTEYSLSTILVLIFLLLKKPSMAIPPVIARARLQVSTQLPQQRGAIPFKHKAITYKLFVACLQQSLIWPARL